MFLLHQNLAVGNLLGLVALSNLKPYNELFVFVIFKSIDLSYIVNGYFFHIYFATLSMDHSVQNADSVRYTHLSSVEIFSYIILKSHIH